MTILSWVWVCTGYAAAKSLSWTKILCRVVQMDDLSRQLWEIDVATGGSSRATHEYPNILRSLTLPAS